MAIEFQDRTKGEWLIEADDEADLLLSEGAPSGVPAYTTIVGTLGPRLWKLATNYERYLLYFSGDYSPHHEDEETRIQSAIEALDRRVRRLEQAAARTPAASVEAIPPTILDSVAQAVSALERSFVLEDAGAVVRHILQRPQLLDTLLATAAAAKGKFDADAVHLRAVDERLVLSIETSLDVVDAEKRFSDFVREWWLSRITVEDRVTPKLRYV